MVHEKARPLSAHIILAGLGYRASKLSGCVAPILAFQHGKVISSRLQDYYSLQQNLGSRARSQKIDRGQNSSFKS